MRGFLAFMILLAGCLPPGRAQALGPGFDFSGIDRFWTMADILEKGREPSEDEWAALFRTPGYRELMRREPSFSPRYFKERIELAFMPSRAGQRKTALEGKTVRGLEHFVRLRAARPDLERLGRDLARGTLLDEALRKAGAFLPAGAMDGEPRPPVAFIFFGPDARGYVPMIIDLGYALDKGAGFVDLLAHEAHHYYRGRSLAYDEGGVQARHAGLFNSLGQLQMEGMADQIDKHEPYFLAAVPVATDYADRYRTNVADAPRLLAEYDKRLAAMADAPARISSLPLAQSGHPTGYYMARRIIDNGDREALVATAGNPFAFFYLYNKAALRDGKGGPFSGKAIGFLRDLERRYCPRPEEDLAAAAMPSGLDLSAYEPFWKIADALGRGQDPAGEEWDRLFRHAAYEDLFKEGWYSRADLQRAIAAAFKPAPPAPPSSREAPLLSHFLAVKARRAEIEASIKGLVADGWAEGILADVRIFLSPALLRKTLPPVLSPVFFYDTMRFGYSVFILDPLRSMSARLPVAFCARKHVLQHYYYAAWPGDPQDVRQRHADVIDTLDGVAFAGFLEAVAPGTRLKSPFQEASPAERAEAEKAFAAALAPSLESLRALDAKLARIDANPKDDAAWRDVALLDFPLGGRPAGDLMRKAIRDGFGAGRLTAVFGDPFAFFLAYQEAALARPGPYPAFSEPALRVIRDLRETYARTGSRP
jgi:hypothetical protein